MQQSRSVPIPSGASEYYVFERFENIGANLLLYNDTGRDLLFISHCEYQQNDGSLAARKVNWLKFSVEMTNIVNWISAADIPVDLDGYLCALNEVTEFSSTSGVLVSMPPNLVLRKNESLRIIISGAAAGDIRSNSRTVFLIL